MRGMAGTEVSAAVSGKMDAMSGEEKKTLKWVMAGASRDMSYMENGYQYVNPAHRAESAANLSDCAKLQRNSVSRTARYAATSAPASSARSRLPTVRYGFGPPTWWPYSYLLSQKRFRHEH